MAERKATNKYYPPDYDPSKGSLNQHVGQHPLRARARKLSEGILVIRFEMPFNIWCGSCERHIARGVRFNAEKKAAGTYYSTTIWSFRMKCPSCSAWFELQTDPKGCTYRVVEGAHRKHEERTAEELGIPEGLTDEQRGALATNPFFRLEHQTQDTRRAAELVPKLGAIKDVSERAWRDDYETSRMLRSKFREEKKAMREERSRVEALREKLSVDVKLGVERPEDVVMARNMTTVATANRKGARQESLTDAAERIRADSIFPTRPRKQRPLSFDHGQRGDDGIDGADEGGLSESLDFKRRKRG